MEYDTSDFDLKGRIRDYMIFTDQLFLKATNGYNVNNIIHAINANIKSNRLNFDEWLDWKADKSDNPFPVELPRLTAESEFRVTILTLFGLEITGLTASGNLIPEKLALQNASASLFDGKAAGSMAWTVSEPLETRVDFFGSLVGVSAQNFLRDTGFLGSRGSLYRYVSSELKVSLLLDLSFRIFYL